MPLWNELSQSSLDSFESDGKVEQIQGRLAQFVQKWRFQNFCFFSSVEITAESVEKTQKFENAIFERMKPIVLGFVRIGWESGTNPRTIRLIRSKVAFQFFLCFVECRIGH